MRSRGTRLFSMYVSIQSLSIIIKAISWLYACGNTIFTRGARIDSIWLYMPVFKDRQNSTKMWDYLHKLMKSSWLTQHRYYLRGLVGIRLLHFTIKLRTITTKIIVMIGTIITPTTPTLIPIVAILLASSAYGKHTCNITIDHVSR